MECISVRPTAVAAVRPAFGSFAVLVSVLTLAACGTADRSRWFEVPSRGLRDEDVYEKCLLSLQLANLKAEKADVAAGRIVTQWDVNLVPFYRPRGQGGAGFRRRAIIEIEPVGDTPPELNVKKIRVRVERERNAEERRPGDPRQAKWEPDSDDTHLAQEIAVRIQERTMPFQPSEDFYRRFGRDEVKGDSETGPKKP